MKLEIDSIKNSSSNNEYKFDSSLLNKTKIPNWISSVIAIIKIVFLYIMLKLECILNEIILLLN